jgi:hypothetical protein
MGGGSRQGSSTSTCSMLPRALAVPLPRSGVPQDAALGFTPNPSPGSQALPHCRAGGPGMQSKRKTERKSAAVLRR